MKMFLKRHWLPLIATIVVIVSLLALWYFTGSIETAATWVLVTIVVVLALIVLASLLAAAYLHLLPDKKHLNRRRGNYSDGTDQPQDNQQPRQPPEQRVLAVAAPAKKKRRTWLLIDVAIIIVLGVVWFRFEGPIIRTLWPLAVQASGLGHQSHGIGQPHLPSGAPVQACTAPKPPPVTVTKDGVTRIDTPYPCTLHLDDITAPTEVFELSCWDKDDEYHETWDAACDTAKAAGLRLKDDQTEDSREVPISFI
ncbi:MAG TPA: hypothetical protein VGN56_00160 [Candidatus Paceibacterota bacterium]|jgi:hypothetical protein|nr:hypothetical protein [Candidatus Paceibacterota bacterium]